MQAPAQAPAVPRATVRRAAATEAALSALRANTAKALASALSGKALGGIVNGTAGALSGSLPIDPITAVIEAGRNSTVRLDAASNVVQVMPNLHNLLCAWLWAIVTWVASTCCRRAASNKAMRDVMHLPPILHVAFLCLCFC